MKKIILLSILLTFISCKTTEQTLKPVASATPIPVAKRAWSTFETPGLEKTEAIGGSGAGCLAGAKRLNEEPKDFVMMRPSRKRYWGHTELTQFLSELGTKVHKDLGRVLIIGDLAQPRGGLLPGNHVSHQNGLDVDLWYDLLKKVPADFSREEFSATSMVANPKAFGEKQERLLRMIAKDKRVERVFVNAQIKKRLCKKYKNATWLKTLRPWWGHADHLHVRLHCPKSDKACISGGPIPEGTGCGKELDWWFTEEARLKGLEKGPPPQDKAPAPCEVVRLAP